MLIQIQLGHTLEKVHLYVYYTVHVHVHNQEHYCTIDTLWNNSYYSHSGHNLYNNEYIHYNTLHCPVNKESFRIVFDSVESKVMTILHDSPEQEQTQTYSPCTHHTRLDHLNSKTKQL